MQNLLTSEAIAKLRKYYNVVVEYKQEPSGCVDDERCGWCNGCVTKTQTRRFPIPMDFTFDDIMSDGVFHVHTRSCYDFGEKQTKLLEKLGFKADYTMTIENIRVEKTQLSVKEQMLRVIDRS